MSRLEVKMPFTNPSDDAIAELLLTAKTIAIVGVSDNPQRPSHEVASALLEFGHRIIPVNPVLAAWQGQRAIPDLEQLSDVLDAGERVDIVGVFRQPEQVDGIVASCLRLKLPTLWLQLGVINERAAWRAQEGGMTVVMDRCMKIERQRAHDTRAQKR